MVKYFNPKKLEEWKGDCLICGAPLNEPCKHDEFEPIPPDEKLKGCGHH